MQKRARRMRRATRRGKKGEGGGRNAGKREAVGGRELACGGDGGGRSKRAVLHSRRWVVERGLPRLCLSHFRSQRPFFFLVFVLSPSLFLSRFRSLSHLLSLVLLSRFCLVRARLSQPFYFAISFPRQRSFFSPSNLYVRLPSSSFPPLANLAPVSPPFTRALFRLLLRSVPTACVSTVKSIDRNVFRSGRNERECNRREWGGI